MYAYMYVYSTMVRVTTFIYFVTNQIAIVYGYITICKQCRVACQEFNEILLCCSIYCIYSNTNNIILSNRTIIAFVFKCFELCEVTYIQ